MEYTRAASVRIVPARWPHRKMKMNDFCIASLRADEWLWRQTSVKRFFLVWFASMGFTVVAALGWRIGDDWLMLGFFGWPMLWLAIVVAWESAIGHLVIAVAAWRWFAAKQAPIDGAGK